jgi:hypothetical protein
VKKVKFNLSIIWHIFIILVVILMNLLYLGHTSFRIITDDNLVIYVDPYAGDNYQIPADIVLITHEHYDHNDIKKINLKKIPLLLEVVRPLLMEYIKLLIYLA